MSYLFVDMSNANSSLLFSKESDESLHLCKKLMIHSLTKHVANRIGSLCEPNR